MLKTYSWADTDPELDNYLTMKRLGKARECHTNQKVVAVALPFHHKRQATLQKSDHGSNRHEIDVCNLIDSQ